MCSDKNHECFHTGLILIMQGIYLRGERYAWAPTILAMLYKDIHSFISVKKYDNIVAHLFILQEWIYDHICMARKYLYAFIQAGIPH